MVTFPSSFRVNFGFAALGCLLLAHVVTAAKRTGFNTGQGVQYRCAVCRAPCMSMLVRAVWVFRNVAALMVSPHGEL